MYGPFKEAFKEKLRSAIVDLVRARAIEGVDPEDDMQISRAIFSLREIIKKFEE